MKSTAEEFAERIQLAEERLNAVHAYRPTCRVASGGERQIVAFITDDGHLGFDLGGVSPVLNKENAETLARWILAVFAVL